MNCQGLFNTSSSDLQGNSKRPICYNFSNKIPLHLLLSFAQIFFWPMYISPTFHNNLWFKNTTACTMQCKGSCRANVCTPSLVSLRLCFKRKPMISSPCYTFYMVSTSLSTKMFIDSQGSYVHIPHHSQMTSPNSNENI